MATLNQALNTSLEGYAPVENQPALQGAAPPLDMQPGINTMLRCPLPAIASSPDSLRQFYLGGKIPQMRVLPLPVQSSTTGGGTVIQNVSVTSTAASGSSSTSTITAKTTGLTTPTLNPGQQYFGALALSRSFQLLSMTANQACRIQLYGTKAAQTQDSGRALDFPPAAGTLQNLISDLAFDTPPYAWAYQNRIGANGDSPQNPTLYLTVTNLGTLSATITVTLAYVALEA